MNETENAKTFSPSASEYINDNFKPSERIAVLVLNRSLRETTQRITTAQKAASPEFQAWLRYKNANGADIYVGMNPLKQDASTRTKDDIETIRHLYIDLDHGGSAALEAIKNSDLVPQPNYVLNTSPDKFQVVWKVEGITPEEAEALQRGMVREFGGDPAATDSTRVLRLPGFANKKYDQISMCRPVSNQRRHTTFGISRFRLIHRMLRDPTMKRPLATIALPVPRKANRSMTGPMPNAHWLVVTTQKR